MNQPTEDRIKKIEEKQEDIDKRLVEVERRTEPIPVTRVEVASADVLNQLKALEQSQQELKQELHTISNTWLETLQEHYTEHTEAISDVKTVQSGHSKFFEEHGKRLAATATKEDISRLETTTATKEDTSTIETRLDKIEGLILQLIQQKPSEGQP